MIVFFIFSGYLRYSFGGLGLSDYSRVYVRDSDSGGFGGFVIEWLL